jgi:2-hydroxy-3-oxopropionate reductase
MPAHGRSWGDRVSEIRTVGTIGLGVMGGPMAANLVAAGFDVLGFTRSRAPMERLKATGGRIAASIADLARESDVVMTVLPDSPDVEAVMLGDDGVFAHARAGALCIDMSTVLPATAVMLNQAALARGLRFIDAPISGGEQGAVDGALSIMVGGSVNDFDAAQPVFRALGTTIVHVGSAGSGQTVKAANQLIVAGTIELVAEALVFLEAHDVDTKRAVEALAGGLAGSRILDRKATGMRMREFKPGFRVDLHHKDLGILLDAARAKGSALPVGVVVGQLMASLRAQGDGGLDHTALLRLVEQLSARNAK